MLTMTLTLTQTLTLTLLTLVPCSVLTTADPVRGLYCRLYLILEAENEAAVGYCLELEQPRKPVKIP